MNHLLVAVMCVSLFFATAMAQDALAPAHAGPSSGLTITTDVEHAPVFVNDVAMGATPLTLAGLEPGVYRLRIAHPQGESWLVNTIHDSIQLADQEHRSLTYMFDTRVVIYTEPFGATVFAGSEPLGTTPLVLQTREGRSAAHLIIEKPGYERVQLEKLQSPGMTVHMKRSTIAGEIVDVMPGEIYTASGAPARIYLSGIAAVLAGSAAAYFKVRADNVYADYRFTRDPALLARTNRLDTAAGIALVATQVSLGLFTYFLLAE